MLDRDRPGRLDRRHVEACVFTYLAAELRTALEHPRFPIDLGVGAGERCSANLAQAETAGQGFPKGSAVAPRSPTRCCRSQRRSRSAPVPTPAARSARRMASTSRQPTRTHTHVCESLSTRQKSAPAPVTRRENPNVALIDSQHAVWLRPTFADRSACGRPQRRSDPRGPPRGRESRVPRRQAECARRGLTIQAVSVGRGVRASPCPSRAASAARGRFARLPMRRSRHHDPSYPSEPRRVRPRHLWSPDHA